jgi:AraC-like DNA-binding protein
VDVAAFLPPALLSHLRLVLGPEHSCAAAEDWASLGWMLRRQAIDVAVIDPLIDGASCVSEIVMLLERHPSLPVVLYTSLTPPALRAVAELAKHGVHQVVLHRFDDEPRRMLELLEQQPGLALGDQLLDALGAPLSKLPISLARAVERLFRQPRQFTVSGDLAASAGMPVRTLYRTLEGAGFASPKALLRGARLLRAFALLKEAGRTADDVSAALGYCSRQRFALHVREVFGVTVAQLRRELTADTVVERLVALFVPAGGAPASAAAAALAADEAAGGER